MAILVNSQTVIFNDRTVKVSSGATRPASPVTGMFWYNTALAQLEVWNGTAWRPQNISAGVKPQNAYAWGNNGTGRLGDNTTTGRSSPVSVVGGFTDWIDISAGRENTAGVRANGTAWGWGNNGTGRLGDNTTTNRSSPVSVVGGFTDWVQVTTGFNVTLAVRANGTAYAWGAGGNGALGNNATTDRSSPVLVAGGFTNWVQVDVGFNNVAGIRANGVAYGWGNNGSGQTGDGTTTQRNSPVVVVGGFTDWVQVSAGGNHHVGVRANGVAYGWGNNGNGRLGDNTTTNRSSPVSVVGGYTDWVQIAAGGEHTAAVRANGTAWGWGNNGNGRLGDGTITARSSPVSVVGGFTDWVQVSAGGRHTVAVRANGTAWAWGYNLGGRLGNNGAAFTVNSPVSVVGGFTDWVKVDSNYNHTAALRG